MKTSVLRPLFGRITVLKSFIKDFPTLVRDAFLAESESRVAFV